MIPMAKPKGEKVMKESNTHDRTIEDDADIIDLGVASVETKGEPGLVSEIDDRFPDGSITD